MNTTATLHSNGHIDAKTETKTVTWFGGFTGGFQLIFFDAKNIAIGMSNGHAFGVDGTAVGRSDRVDYWGEDIDSRIATCTARIAVLQFWSPKYAAINAIVQKAVQIGQTASPLLQELKSAGLMP
jgi:hypothetical protein